MVIWDIPLSWIGGLVAVVCGIVLYWLGKSSGYKDGYAQGHSDGIGDMGVAMAIVGVDDDMRWRVLGRALRGEETGQPGSQPPAN